MADRNCDCSIRFCTPPAVADDDHEHPARQSDHQIGRHSHTNNGCASFCRIDRPTNHKPPKPTTAPTDLGNGSAIQSSLTCVVLKGRRIIMTMKGLIKPCPESLTRE